MSRQWLKYDMHYKYSPKKAFKGINGSGIAHGRCTLGFVFSVRKGQIKSWMKRERCYFGPYIPNKNFKGWPKGYYGKRLTVELTKFRIKGIAHD